MPGPGSAEPHAATVSSHGWRGWFHRTLAVIRANPTGRVALKVGVGTLGLIVFVIGVVLIPLPGPGWAIVIVALAIWAIEFVWAKHLLRFTRRHVQAWTHWVARQSLPLRMMLAVVGLLFVTTVVWLSLKMSLNIDLIVVARDIVAKR